MKLKKIYELINNDKDLIMDAVIGGSYYVDNNYNWVDYFIDNFDKNIKNSINNYYMGDNNHYAFFDSEDEATQYIIDNVINNLKK